ncbi:MAG: Alginate O-acetyltransferase AlgJ [Parcubacteria group bacterium GW2011_GWC2_49_9]|nr:MAG: Alginate O-acetyltransferase AlgJ [Parcubacteria group bacterium GW2011_GWC2_49_9]
MENRFQNVTRWSERLLILVFLITISSPGISLIAGYGSDTTTVEKRELALFPKFSASSVLRAPFRRGFEEYFNDHFGFRDMLVRMGSVVSVELFKRSPNSKVAVGKNDWLFFLGDDILNDFQGKYQINNEAMNQIVDNIDKKQEWLANRDTDFYILVAPNKTTIYPELLPDSIRSSKGTTLLEQIAPRLEQESDIHFIDPRDTLIKAKSERLTYEKTGTHWNQYGAFLAYDMLIDEMRKDHPELTDADLSTYKISQKVTGGSDLVILLSLQEKMKDELVYLDPKKPRSATDAEVAFINPNQKKDMPLVAKKTPYSDMPRALIFRDSFANLLVPFLSEHFSRSVYVWIPLIDERIVEIEKPDIVILEITERFLYSTLYSDLQD